MKVGLAKKKKEEEEEEEKESEARKGRDRVGKRETGASRGKADQEKW